jgi:hypothetical protein
MQTFKFNKKEMSQKDLLDPTNPIHESFANLISVATNAPTDKIFYKTESLKHVLNSELDAWQRIAISLGWRHWQVGVNDRKKKKDKVFPTISPGELDDLINTYDGGGRKGFKRKGFERKGFEKKTIKN